MAIYFATLLQVVVLSLARHPLVKYFYSLVLLTLIFAIFRGRSDGLSEPSSFWLMVQLAFYGVVGATLSLFPKHGYLARPMRFNEVIPKFVTFLAVIATTINIFILIKVRKTFVSMDVRVEQFKNEGLANDVINTQVPYIIELTSHLLTPFGLMAHGLTLYFLMFGRRRVSRIWILLAVLGSLSYPLYGQIALSRALPISYIVVSVGLFLYGFNHLRGRRRRKIRQYSLIFFLGLLLIIGRATVDRFDQRASYIEGTGYENAALYSLVDYGGQSWHFSSPALDAFETERVTMFMSLAYQPARLLGLDYYTEDMADEYADSLGFLTRRFIGLYPTLVFDGTHLFPWVLLLTGIFAALFLRTAAKRGHVALYYAVIPLFLMPALMFFANSFASYLTYQFAAIYSFMWLLLALSKRSKDYGSQQRRVRGRLTPLTSPALNGIDGESQ